jgi:hypothetical protein
MWNLYTPTLCTSLGIEALNYWLDKYNDIPQRFSKELIIESLVFILDNNTFQFNNEFYRQIKGTSMGTKVAPTYATLTIGYLEQKLYNQVKDQSLWKRFLDDCFITWTKSKGDLETLHILLNGLHEYIRFTMDVNEKQLPFLDCIDMKN